MELDFNTIELCVKLDILKIKLYVYFKVGLNISNVKFHLNFQKKKKLNDKIYIELDIANVKLYIYNLIFFFFK